ncbi:hypothetical protein HU200_048983 [Digitaria exilis]|uniref:Uncharacterized protein n=1 Tax=Digitaria exilis TaxID=1010633 RepID=A0A835EAJ7_9POAL|nr:hypothetical protein HU200_048983 [Digitaria exilis]
MMHRVINKTHIEKLIEEGNVYSIANVRVTSEAQKYRPVQNDNILNFLPTITLTKIKDTEEIPNSKFYTISQIL